MVDQIIFFIGLSRFAYEDYKKKEVSLAGIAVLGIFGVLLRVLDRGTQWLPILAGMMIGMALLLFSCLSGGKIGAGDGWILVVSPMYLEFWDNLSMFIRALYLAGAVGLLLFFLKRCKKEDTLPFFPFLLAGYVILLCQKGGT